MAAFRWTVAAENAANMIATREKTFDQIADEVGVTRRTLYTWRQNPAFAARVNETIEYLASEIQRIGVAVKIKRIEALNDRVRLMQQIIDERAKDPAMANVPGGSTGLLVRQTKGIGKGSDFRIVEEYSLDAALLREFREHEKQAALELGQWVLKVETKAPESSTIDPAAAERALAAATKLYDEGEEAA